MLMRSLEAYGIPEVLLDAWQQNYGPELLAIQERTVTAGVLGGASLVVSAPTSSGKTFIGEMAAAHAAMNGRKVIYLVPTKALAEAKYRQFNSQYEPLGLRIAIATSDRRGQQDRIARGEFDVTVAVPEKMRTLLLNCPALASGIGAVVADELQVIGDAERGPCLELVLADLLHNADKVQFIGLSAVLRRTEEVARWLGADLIRDEGRPVELRKGVLVGDTYYCREHISGRLMKERWPELGQGPEELGARLAQVANYLASREAGSVLVFMPDKYSTVRVARQIAEESGLPAADTLGEELAVLEATQATEYLTELTRQGVAFHNADLQFEERAALERGFARGELAVLVCTSTLAMGVNLPARDVLVDVRRWHIPTRGRPTLGAITRADFENMAGRAGRLGYEEQFGRAILLADSELRRQILFDAYIDADFAELAPQFAKQSPLQQVCLLAGSEASSQAGGIVSAYQRTLSAEMRDAPCGALPPPLTEAARYAAEMALLTEEGPEGGWQATALGRLCGTSGLSPASFFALLKAARAAGDRPPDRLEALFVAALCDEAQAVPLPSPSSPHARFIEALREAAAPCDSLDACLEQLLAAGPTVAASAARREHAARITLALRRWQSREATLDIEQSLRIPAGRLAALGETVGWIVQTLARIGRELARSGAAEAGWRRLSRFGESIAAGVPEEGLRLHRLCVPGFTRGHVIGLLEAGISSPDDLAETDEGELSRLLGSTLSRRVLAAANGLHPRSDTEHPICEVPCPAAEVTNPRSEAHQHRPKPQLVVDSHRPDCVMFFGTPVKLRPAEFRLLRALAQQPGMCVSYEEIYQEMWGGEQFVEPAQIYSHRSRMAKKLRSAVSRQGDTDRLIRTIPTHGLVLDLPPERVLVR